MVSPSLTNTAEIVPSTPASTGCSIFIDSKITISRLARTVSPGFTEILNTVPRMGEETLWVAMAHCLTSAVCHIRLNVYQVATYELPKHRCQSIWVVHSYIREDPPPDQHGSWRARHKTDLGHLCRLCDRDGS